MSKLPRNKIEPLSPPPGSFDQVVKGAQARRRRRGVYITSSVAVLALVSGVSFAVGNSMGVTQRIISAAQGFTDSAPTPTVTPAATNQASPERAAATTKSLQVPTQPAGVGTVVVTTPATPAANSFLRGKVVDPDGAPVAGLFVQPGSTDHATFRSTGLTAAVTDDQGEFQIPCPRAPVLVATWQLNRDVTATTVGREWGAIFVGGSQTSPVVPACGKSRSTTIISGGATITGTVLVAGDCSDTTFPLQVWLDGNRHNAIRINGLRNGDAFSFSGLPPGSHVLDAQGLATTLDLPPGGSLEQTAAFTCPVTTGTATPKPTDSSSTATPTPTATRSQTSGPTTEPATTAPTG